MKNVKQNKKQTFNRGEHLAKTAKKQKATKKVNRTVYQEELDELDSFNFIGNIHW